MKSGIVLDPKQTQELSAEKGIVQISEWFEDETRDLQDSKGIGCSSSYNNCKWLFVKEVKWHTPENVFAQDITVPLMFRQGKHRIIYTKYDEALMKEVLTEFKRDKVCRDCDKRRNVQDKGKEDDPEAAALDSDGTNGQVCEIRRCRARKPRRHRG